MIKEHVQPPVDPLASALSALASVHNRDVDRRQLLALLQEDSPLYRGRASTEVEQIRAHVMVSLAKAGLADDLLPYILEELETGTNAHAVAAAARAARSVASLPDETIGLLTTALHRIWNLDEFVELDAYPASAGTGPTTVVGELIETLAMSGPDGRAAVRTLWPRLSVYKHVSATARRLLEASFLHEDSAVSCCACSKAAKVAEPQPIAQSIAALHDIELENQDGMRASFGKTFRGRTSLIAFFYTRCMNPDKCSRTVSKLARVHNLLDHKLPQSSAMVAGITYDPEYDSAARLRSYGIDRGMSFDERCQLLRSTGSFADVRDALGLGVGYGSSTVNRHRIELLVVDPSGKILDSNLRRLWDEHEVADRLVAIETADTTRAA